MKKKTKHQLEEEKQLEILEETEKRVKEIVAELDRELTQKEITAIQHNLAINQLLMNKTPEEIIDYLELRKKKTEEHIKEDSIKMHRKKIKQRFLIVVAIILTIAIMALLLTGNGLKSF